jgi:hypothetical protein
MSTTPTIAESYIPADRSVVQQRLADLPGGPVRAGGHIIGVVLAAVETHGGIRVVVRLDPSVQPPPTEAGASIDASIVPRFASHDDPVRRRLTRTTEPEYPWQTDTPIGGCNFFADNEITDWRDADTKEPAAEVES